MTKSITTDHNRAALNARFTRISAATETPESMGRALHRWLLSEGVSKGEISADGKTITIPLSIPLGVPPPASPSERKTSFGYCLSSFGYDFICIKAQVEETP